VPVTPTFLIAVGANQQVTLTWTASDYAVTYNLYRSTTTGAEGSTPFVTGISTATYTDTGLVNGTTYFYTVVAVNDSGSSAAGTEIMATPYPAPTGLTGIGGYKMNLLTWSPVSGAGTGGGYIVSRSTTSGGPYTQISGQPINGMAYLDSDHGAGLSAANTYYYTVKYLDANYQASPQSAQTAVTTASSATGWWGIGISATGHSPGADPASSTAYAVGTNNLTTITVAAGLIGAQSADNSQLASSAYTGTWTATFVGSTITAWPQLYVLDEIKSQSASVTYTGTGSGAVYTPSATILGTVSPSGLTALTGAPVTSSVIDMTSDPGHIIFTYDRKTDARTVTFDGEATSAYTESTNDTTHVVNVYTPAYFTAHFTDPQHIVLSVGISGKLTASAMLPAGAPAGADCETFGSLNDAFSNYAVGN